MQVRKQFDLSVYTKSNTAKRLMYLEQFTPSDTVVENLEHLHNAIIVPILENLKGVLVVTSGYRCERLNKAIGGSKTSQHVLGQAVDLEYYENGVEKNLVLFEFIKRNLVFDQLINEKNGSWIHVSYKQQGNRKQVLHVN